MNDLRSTSLILDRRIRGHLPVTRYSVSDVGSVTLAVADPNQPRLYHLGRQSCAGEWEETSSFSVEKVSSWDLAAANDVFIVATTDDFYLFCGGQKTRPLSSNRDSYSGVSITAAGDLFVTASTDMLMSAFSVTLISSDGTVRWTKDLPVTLTCIQISPDGSLIAVGSDEGIVYLIDSERHVIWEFDAGGPVSTVSVPTSDGTVIVGMKSGAVLAIRDGDRVWGIDGHGTVTVCTGTSDGRLVITARDGGDDDHTVECLSADGSFCLSHAVPSRVASVACSDNCRYLAISCRDGTVQVIELQGGSNRLADLGQAAAFLEDGVAMLGRGEYADAVSALRRALEIRPADVGAAANLMVAARSLIGDSLCRAEEALKNGDYGEAVNRLSVAWENCTLAPDTVSEVLSGRRSTVDRIMEHAEELASNGAVNEALDVLNALLSLEVTHIGARELLSDLEQEVTEKLVQVADQARAEGSLADAVRLLEQACDRDPSEAVGKKLRHARAEEALAEGLALYREQRFSEALFQFRKALSLDPENAEALKHIEYAEKLSEGGTLHDRFSRLE